MVVCVLSGVVRSFATVHSAHLLLHLPPPLISSHPLLVMRNGTVEFPKSRVLTAWGEWLWVSTVVSLRKDSSEKADLSSANIRMSILG